MLSAHISLTNYQRNGKFQKDYLLAFPPPIEKAIFKLFLTFFREFGVFYFYP